MTTARWTARTWFLPWLLCGCALFSNAMASPRLLPLVLSLAVWGVVPLRRGPLAFRPWRSRVVAIGYALAVAVGLLAPGNSPWAVLDLPAWAFLGFALHQLLAQGSGGSMAWLRLHSLIALLLPALRTSPEGLAATVAWLALALPELRHASVVALGNRARPWRMAFGLRVVLALVASGWVLAGAGKLRAGWTGGGFQGGRSALPGLSRDGALGSLRDAYGSEAFDAVAARAWGESDPGPLVGTVFQTYARGRWLPFPDGPALGSDRNLGEASVHCLEDDRMEPATHWIRPATDPQTVPWSPEGSACVALVTQELRGNRVGNFTASDMSPSRGWHVFAQRVHDSVRHAADLRLPGDLAGALDSALVEVRERVRPEDPPGDLRPALGRWFDARFRYSLDPALRPEEDPIRGFLRTRQGFCEHFASLSTLLLRRAGWPSRYVKGWSAPEPTGEGIWTWRRGMAHAWVHVLPPGGTWQRFDPTPAGDVPKPTAPGPLRRWLERAQASGQALWHEVRDGAWRERLDVLERLGDLPWWQILPLPLAAALGWFFWRRRKRRGLSVDPWVLRLRRAEERLRRRGLVRAPGETVSSFRARIGIGIEPEATADLDAYVKERFRRIP
ncbi:MAG: hypothetical protein RL318_2402 [Fibrobacterota bacterium]|jgi:hypothetical protein